MATKTKTLTDFMADNDRNTILRNRIRKQLAAMLAICLEQHENERDFCSAAKVSSQDIPDFRAEFKAHIAFVPGLMGRAARYVWFASPKIVPKDYRYNPETPSG